MRSIEETDNTVDEAAQRVEGAEVEPGEQTEEAPEEGYGSAAEFGEHVREVTQHILDLMGLDLTAAVTRSDRYQVDIDLEGPDARIVIGKHGQTLEALQQIVGLIANKATDRRHRVLVDAEGYQQRRRERREQELIEMVRIDAERARESGQEAVIHYAVGPYERRLVHMAFADDPDFTTYSEGEEPHRYVVISPRD
jgi:spoIIIJ-associated protein